MKNTILHVVTAVTFFLFPLLIFAQTPNLGTASTFVLFTSNGAVTNTGASHLTGNVGSNNGAVTGFGNINGVMHTQNGASAQAAADLLIAYYQVDTATPNFFPGSVLGNGDTLNAGVYSISGNSSLNLNLTLNARGNANAVFIFQLQGAFASTSAAQVNLINGAKACNVFWKVEGLVSLATGTQMKGTIIANNAAISIGTGVSLEGRALSTTGAVSVSGVKAYTPTGCGSPVLTGPAAPGLASTACYAIFSGNGSVINAGISNVTGDIGTNVGLAVGFNPLTVNGTIHPIPDVSTASAASDLLNVHAYLHGLSNDIELLYPAQFGNSLVLTPHTYILNGATTFTDTLFLNAEGNSNAVFVIKVNGAFSTSTYATVVLTNGAQASNIFWKIEGAVSLNDYADIKGTIVCNNGAISLNTGVKLAGRALTTNGALSTASVSVAITGGCSTLPLTWLYFTAKPVQKTVLLQWATSSEKNNSFFTVEKSTDGQNFKTITTVNAAAANAKTEYEYADHLPSPINFYRLSQNDKDGRKSFYKTIQVKMNSALPTASHYVQGNYIYVQTANTGAGKATVDLFSIEGKQISSQKAVLTNDVNTFKIEKPSQQGVYLLNIQTSKQQLYHAKVMVF